MSVHDWTWAVWCCGERFVQHDEEAARKVFDLFAAKDGHMPTLQRRDPSAWLSLSPPTPRTKGEGTG